MFKIFLYFSSQFLTHIYYKNTVKSLIFRNRACKAYIFSLTKNFSENFICNYICMQPLVLGWSSSRGHTKTRDRKLMQDVALEDERKRIKRAFTWAKRLNFFWPQQYTYIPTAVPPSLFSARIHSTRWISALERIFFPSVPTSVWSAS